MASTTNVILGTATALLVWTLAGLAVARAVLPDRTLVWPLAPALGWAVHSAAALPLFTLIGFTRTTVTIVTLLTVAASAYALWRSSDRPSRDESEAAVPAAMVPIWAWVVALILSFGCAAAILPKFAGDAVYLAAPIFDHAKVAMIDEMVRLGLPPGNPFFGEDGQPSRLVYYYLLHFSAAELALLLGISGWEADAALTWFSAFASLMLMIGLATWISGRRMAAPLTLLVCATGSLRPLLAMIPGIDSVILPQTGFANWLFQTAWVPQHIASASCVVLAMLLLRELARRESLVLIAVFALVVVAGFASSAWVGGVTFAVAALWIGTVLLANAPPQQRLPLLGRCALAAIGAAVLASPILVDQFAAMGTRGGGSPIVLQTYEVLGPVFPPFLRQLLDMPAFWLILLVIELPAIYLTGLIAMVQLTRHLDATRKPVATILIHLTAVEPRCVLVDGQHHRRQQRSRLAGGAARLPHADRVCGRGPRAVDRNPCPAGDRRRHRDRARPAERRHDIRLQLVRLAQHRGRRSLRRHTGDVGGGAPSRPPGRPGRQQSIVPRRDDAVAGQYLLGAASQIGAPAMPDSTSRYRLCRCRDRGCARSTRSSTASFPATAGRTTCVSLRPNTAAASPS